jgi:transcriptional regulator with XRE-family HTH domain
MVATSRHQGCAVNAATLTSAIRDSGSAKDVARAAGCSVATAARYRRGETLPDPLGLARLMGWSRGIANAMLRLAGLDDLSLDVEEARLWRELQRLRDRRTGPPDAEVDAALADRARKMVGNGE